MDDYFDPTPEQAEAAKRLFAKFRNAPNHFEDLNSDDPWADLRLMGACLRAVCGPVRKDGR